MQMPAIPNAEIQPHAKSATFAKEGIILDSSFGFSRRAAEGAEQARRARNSGILNEKRYGRTARMGTILHPTGESNIVRETVVTPQNPRVSAPLREIKNLVRERQQRNL